MTNARIDYAHFNAVAAQAVQGLGLISKSAADAGLEKDLLELVKLRASQINGCTFCLQYHLNIGRKLGIPQMKFDLLAAWRDAGIFSTRERAAFLWTEALTNIAGHEVTDAIFAEVQAAFPGDQVAHLTTTIAAINAWNRIAVSFQFAPPIPVAA